MDNLSLANRLIISFCLSFVDEIGFSDMEIFLNAFKSPMDSGISGNIL